VDTGLRWALLEAVATTAITGVVIVVDSRGRGSSSFTPPYQPAHAVASKRDYDEADHRTCSCVAYSALASNSPGKRAARRGRHG
jgi:hypothetical protein